MNNSVNLQDIITSADTLIDSMDRYINNRKKFNEELKLEIERYSWELYRTSNEIRALQRIYGD